MRLKSWIRPWTLLNNLDWSRVHEFNKFVKHSAKIGAKGAMCYVSCKKLIKARNPLHHLKILQSISGDDSMSFLAYHIFQTLYHPSTLQENALLLHLKFASHSEFRANFEKNCTTLKERYRKYNGLWYGRPDIFPQNGVYSSYVSEEDHNMDVFGLGCSYKEIVNSSCSECMILMINFKIFRGY
ncbi:hypothetical protein DCAR_0101559 [Daucus carota subsp. sativus]|uniref:Uncharacterized protein n=1 Tax=Daucus carota subsp. sativus TaxID=79200 RepID=A0A166GGE2_DAUCS|nr:hypothetical protein DCAR_0101559 [Daucus carota subsp. sativus]